MAIWLIRPMAAASSKLLSTCNRAVQQNHSGRPFGLKVLKQETAHTTSADNRDLLCFEADQLIKTTGLSQLQLG